MAAAPEKEMRRVQVKARKKLPMPYVPSAEPGTVTRQVCDLTEWTEAWPLCLVCCREPSWPLSYSKEQRRKGCTLFYDRYMELWRADGHTTQTAIGAWELYDHCMRKPEPVPE
eukprot:c27734_g1_i1.p2 GENE.c27734_g1_i1~~c27734_g1_i1.p2  ORF type:complete len:129 (-),score=7.91 c27734_g1_i1:230-568(-)